MWADNFNIGLIVFLAGSLGGLRKTDFKWNRIFFKFSLL
jgi:hypothetical protein